MRRAYRISRCTVTLSHRALPPRRPRQLRLGCRAEVVGEAAEEFLLRLAGGVVHIHLADPGVDVADDVLDDRERHAVDRGQAAERVTAGMRVTALTDGASGPPLGGVQSPLGGLLGGLRAF